MARVQAPRQVARAAARPADRGMTEVEQLALAVRRNLSVDEERREQKRQLARVRGHIAESVLEYARMVGTGATFSVESLQRFVRGRARAAPASPDRILRDLRRRGELDYVVVSRTNALYRFTKVPT